MGLGGDLLWTPVLRKLSEKHNQPILLYDTPRLSDFVLGCNYNRRAGRHFSPIFSLNPFVTTPDPLKEGRFFQRVNDLWTQVTQCNRSHLWMQAWYYKRSCASGFQFVYMDLPVHSYVKNIEEDRYHWKSGGHIIDIIGASLGLSNVPHQCELYFTFDEEACIDRLVKELSLHVPFLVIEPNTNTDFFGDLRAWPFNRWQAVVDTLREEYPELPVVQVGVKGSCVLKGVLDTCGLLSFRETALLIQRSCLFMGTEGGLMHVANAVQTAGLIVWSGVTDPNFAGYPDKDQIVHIGAHCAPCGLFGSCPNHHECIQGICVDMVMENLSMVLNSLL